MNGGGFTKDIDRWLSTGPGQPNFYERKDDLGSGGIAKTYYAKVTKAGKQRILDSKKGKIKEHEIPDYVALKVSWFSEGISTADNELEMRLQLEMQDLGVEREGALADIPHHRNNVIVYDSGKNQVCSWVALEYVDDAFPAEALPLDQCVEAIIQSGRGIQWLHENDIIHRDIKPENMLITARSKIPGDLQKFKRKNSMIENEYSARKTKLQEEYQDTKESLKKLAANDFEHKEQLEDAIRNILKQIYDVRKDRTKKKKQYAELYGVTVQPGNGVKNCDFNLAKKKNIELGDRITTGNVVKGTPNYMSPEQTKGDYNVRTDIYSLGASLYTMATGEALYFGDTYEEIVLQINNPNVFPADPRVLNPNIDKDLAMIIARAMHPNPKRRYPSVGLLIKDLEDWQYNRNLNFVEKLFRKRKLSRIDYTPVVFTRYIEPEKRVKTLAGRLTATIVYGPERKFEELKESVEQIKSTPKRLLAKCGLYLIPAAVAVALGLGAYAMYLWGKSAAERSYRESRLEKSVESEKNER
jgi:serine/threonine protein kinase